MKLEYSKEWFEQSARIEGDAEVGAGLLLHDRINNERTGETFGLQIALGQFVELWRRNQGWSAEKLAAEAGIELQDLLRIERDWSGEIDADVMSKLASVFGVPLRRLQAFVGSGEGECMRVGECTVPYRGGSANVEALSEFERGVLDAFSKQLDSTIE